MKEIKKNVAAKVFHAHKIFENKHRENKWEQNRQENHFPNSLCSLVKQKAKISYWNERT